MTSKRPPPSFYLTDRHSVNDQLTQNSSHLRHPRCLGQPCLVSRYNRTELPVPQPRHSGRGEEHLYALSAPATVTDHQLNFAMEASTGAKEASCLAKTGFNNGFKC